MARTRHRLDGEMLRPSGAILGANIALGAVIERDAVEATGHDPTTLDLLVRLDLSDGRQLRGVELGRQLQLSQSHVSRMIDRAEGAGLVERRPDPADRRAQLVTLTDAGGRVVADFAPRLHAVLQSVVFDVLNRDEVDTLVDLVGRIETACTQRLTRLDQPVP